MKDYRILNEKDKERIFGIKSFLIYDFFVKRNYSRDLDIVIFEKMRKGKLNEIDLRRFEELPELIKFLSSTQAFDFLRFYINFVEWLIKWM